MVRKLDRPTRSLPDARGIAEELTRKCVAFKLGCSLCDPHDPVGKLLFNVLGMVAEFETDPSQAKSARSYPRARRKTRRSSLQS